jgi:spore germination protein YaaH
VDRRPVPAPLRRSNERSLSIGFYVNWDDNSYPDLKRALPHLDWMIPSWLSLEGPALELKADINDRVLKLVQESKPDLPIVPMIQNAVDGKWDGPGLARLLANPSARAVRIDEIVAFLETSKFQGLTIDFEEVPAKSQKDLRDFLSEISSAFIAHGVAMVLAVCHSRGL